MTPIPVAYVVGNHMHWVDMEWLWGYHVLPGSVRDMLDLCRAAGVKACVNFDAVGYEKLAVEAPEALAELRAAIAQGIVEPVGCSYGQPYGLFHGGESNIRQRVYGVRSTLRLLGVRPRAFWEEEFDFFPQLPQILAGCGFTGACLFFQWTWHTPEVPVEDVPVVLWEGVDGTRLPAVTRNRLNLHQWPEDMDAVLGEFAADPARFGEAPVILQWLELMPSPDWMCRSELILPKLEELRNDPRFDVRPKTLSEALADAPPDLPVRPYRMHDVWHGLSLGKNGDAMRTYSFRTEQDLLDAEFLAATLSLFGRPYAQWDVYPVWPFEEAWRELLIAQHHDNDECEGLCGDIGRAHYDKAALLTHDACAALRRLAAERVRPSAGGFGGPHWRTTPQPEDLGREEPTPCDETVHWSLSGGRFTLDASNARFEAEIGAADPWPISMSLGWRTGGADRSLVVGTAERRGDAVSVFGGQGDPISLFFRPLEVGLELAVITELALDPGFGGALCLRFMAPGGFDRIWSDYPYQVAALEGTSSGKRKYPEGDWMTSPQWFETVEGAFTGLSFVDLGRRSSDGDASGLLIAFEGARQWFRDPDGAVRIVLDLDDPWDGDFASCAQLGLTLIPHGDLTPADRVRLVRQCRSQQLETSPEGDIPGEFQPVVCRDPHVIVTAFHREAEDFAGRGLDRYAGRGMGYPFVLRLVEYDGVATTAEVVVAGPVAKAYRTNLMGEIEAELTSLEAPADALGPGPEALDPFGIVPRTLQVPMRPHEIATLYLDLVPGRKQVRDLDAKREVWATVHRTES